jgi:dienelactone hydrolase
LNDQIKNVARELAQKGFLERAVELMDGRVATTRNDTKR